MGITAGNSSPQRQLSALEGSASVRIVLPRDGGDDGRSLTVKRRNDLAGIDFAETPSVRAWVQTLKKLRSSGIFVAPRDAKRNVGLIEPRI